MIQVHPPLIWTRQVHILKTDPEPFQAVLEGRKRAEVRVADRNFAVNDLLILAEYLRDEFSHGPSGRATLVRITHVLPGGSYGIPETHVVLSIAPVEDLACSQ